MMKNKLIIVIFTAFTVLLAGNHSKVQPDLKKELIQESINEFIGESVKLHDIAIPLQDIYPEVRSKLKILKSRELDTLYVSFFIHKGKSIVVIPAQSKGKTLDFSFLVYVDLQSDEIVNVDVVEYRETHGMEIDYPVFRKQFRGKKKPNEIIFRRHIRNITGATISARSITMAVRDVLIIYQKAKSRILKYVQY